MSSLSLSFRLSPLPSLFLHLSLSLSPSVSFSLSFSLSLPFTLFLSDTTREPRSDDDHRNFHFISEEQMRLDIMSHKFIEFGKHQQHIYGIKAESVMEVIEAGKMCILDVHPQVSTITLKK